MVRRTIYPRNSSPLSDIAEATMCDRSGWLATITLAPGTVARTSNAAKRRKKLHSSPRSSSSSTVKRGNGARLCPSNDGGMRHTPPLPLRNFACSFLLYSMRPYGGSVTTAWMEQGSHCASQSKQSTLRICDLPVSIRHQPARSNAQTKGALLFPLPWSPPRAMADVMNDHFVRSDLVYNQIVSDWKSSEAGFARCLSHERRSGNSPRCVLYTIDKV